MLEKDKSVREILQTALELCKTQFLANSFFSKEYVEHSGMKQSFVEMRILVYEGLAALFEQLICQGVETGELQVRDQHLAGGRSKRCMETCRSLPPDLSKKQIL